MPDPIPFEAPEMTVTGDQPVSFLWIGIDLARPVGPRQPVDLQKVIDCFKEKPLQLPTTAELLEPFASVAAAHRAADSDALTGVQPVSLPPSRTHLAP